MVNGGLSWGWVGHTEQETADRNNNRDQPCCAGRSGGFNSTQLRLIILAVQLLGMFDFFDILLRGVVYFVVFFTGTHIWLEFPKGME